MGILTDHTNPATMGERSNKKRSSEEINVTKLINLFKDKGVPPVRNPRGRSCQPTVPATSRNGPRRPLRGPFTSQVVRAAVALPR
jgi:hypothetical protein